MMSSCGRAVVGFLFGCYAVYSLADQTAADYKTEITPTMAAFYIIDVNGRSVRDNPSVPAIGNREIRTSQPVSRTQPKPKKIKTRKPGPRKIVLFQLPRAPYDSREAFRCERHGFYYTNDGRCILPIMRGASPRH